MKPKLIRRSWDLLSNSFPRFSCEIDYLRKNRNFERDLWLVPRFCSKQTIAVDVGANTGIYSRWMAKFARKVEAFECNPVLISKLTKFLPENVHLHQCGLSSSDGKTLLRFDPLNTGVGTIEALNKLDQNPGIRTVTELEVPMRKLDDFQLDRVTFVKIDVEGHELEVLKGAATLIERDRPALLMEIEERHRPGNLEVVPRWLREFGYRPNVLDVSGQLVRVSSVESAARGGINNVWFLPTSG